MVKLEINIAGVITRLSTMANNLNTIPWCSVGNIVRDSVHQNFDSGGRPVKWPPRKDNKAHPLLIESGTLKNSIYVEEIPNGVAIGTREHYQAVHNFGYPRKNIPQLKYLMTQPDDVQKINKTISDHIRKK